MIAGSDQPSRLNEHGRGRPEDVLTHSEFPSEGAECSLTDTSLLRNLVATATCIPSRRPESGVPPVHPTAVSPVAV
jgi:hypothetical protein